MQILPAIDIIGNKCVRLTQGDYSTEKQYSISPLEMAGQFADSGATWIHVVDLEGAKAGRVVNWNSIIALRSLQGLAIEFGGGVRTQLDVERLLGIGVDRVIVGSVALSSPELFAGWTKSFGPDCF